MSGTLLDSRQSPLSQPTQAANVSPLMEKLGVGPKGDQLFSILYNLSTGSGNLT